MDFEKPCLMIVSHSLSRTGAPKVALDIAYYFEQQYKVVLLSLNQNTPNKWLVEDSMIVHELPRCFSSLSCKFLRLINSVVSFVSFKNYNLKRLWFLFLLAKYRPIAVIHNTMYHSDLQKVSNAFNVKSIRYLHEDEFFLQHLSQCDVDVFNKGSITIGCSPSVLLASESRRITIFPKFIPPQADDMLETSYKDIHKPSSMYLKVISVGSDQFRKGADLADDISESISHNFEYHWYGFLDSPSFRTIEYFGNVPNVPYSVYDVFAFTSRSDTWGIAVLEALANGLFIVGWDHLPLIFELAKYNLAIAVPQYDVVSFALAIESCKERTQDMSIVRSFLSQYTSSILYGQTLNDLI